MEKDKKDKKYNIIEPFLNREKKLRDIEKESNISYATLKRWVSQYKESGENGLIKKTRVDKNTFKKVNKDTLQYLKELYNDYNNLPITKLYEKAKTTTLSYNNMISYPTFFRIVNNLDESIKLGAIKSLKKDKIFEYGIIQKILPLPFFNNKNEIFYLTIFYNKENYKIINFLFEEKKRNLKKLFNFIRESIIIEGEYPRNISLDNNVEGVSKNLLKEIYFKTKIDLIQEELDQNILDFLKYIEIDVLKEFQYKKPKTKIEVSIFLKRYFFIDENRGESLNADNLNKLLYFISKYKRKIYKNGVIVKNNQYNNSILKDYESYIADVFYNEFQKNFVEIYINGDFLVAAELIKE
ncbi:MAG: helix-turn-helix domain-containing protein [Cetobacterium sp.]